MADKPNILVLWGDDIGWWNVSTYNHGSMGYRTPNIDRIGREGAMFTDWYGQQSCTAGRAAFITGQSPIRTGLTKVGLPGAKEGLTDRRPDDRRPAQASTATPPASSARTTSATATSTCPRSMASTSSSATSITSTPRRSRSTRTIPGPSASPTSGTDSARAVSSTPGRQTRTTTTEDPRFGRVGKQTHRGHRTADQEADGDGRRGVPRRRHRLHRPGARGGQAVLRLVELDPDARLHPSQGGVPGRDRPRGLSRRDGRARRSRRPVPRQARRARHRRQHDRDLLDRQRRRGDDLARRRAPPRSAARRPPTGRVASASRC